MKKFFSIGFIIFIAYCGTSFAQERGQPFIEQISNLESTQYDDFSGLSQFNYDSFIMQEIQLSENFSPFSHVKTQLKFSKLSSSTTDLINHNQPLAKKLTFSTFWQLGEFNHWQISLASKQLFWTNTSNQLNPALSLQTLKQLTFSSHYFITPNWKITGQLSNTSITSNFDHYPLPQSDQQAIIGTTYRF